MKYNNNLNKGNDNVPKGAVDFEEILHDFANTVSVREMSTTLSKSYKMYLSLKVNFSNVITVLKNILRLFLCTERH